jgi:plasmid maintenance system antidote protein VapI
MNNQTEFIKLIEEMGLSNADAARELKITHQQVNNLIAGRRGVSDQLLCHLRLIRDIKKQK